MTTALSAQRFIGLASLPLYFVATLTVGWFARSRSQGTSNAFLNASHSLPLPVVVGAYLAANCGALEVVGLSAFAAQYGVQALQFYLIGAIPAIIFLSIWMMPVYARSGVASVPAYMERRFGSKMRLVNACVTGCMMPLLGGVSLYALAQVLAVLGGVGFGTSIVLCSFVVLAYVLLGGLRATIYNEFFQLGVILAGLVPLSMRLWRQGALDHLSGVGPQFHLWQGVHLLDRGSVGDAVGWMVGLGFVLSFSYWCTDFVMMQRALTAKTEYQARQVPLWAGFGKLLFSLLVVLPGLAATQLVPGIGTAVRADRALPSMMKLMYGPALLGIGITALVASLMSGLSANASGFAAIWTEEIYRPYLRPGSSEAHYVSIGRLASAVCVVAGAAASYINFFFGNMMEHVQLIFSVAGAPFWAVFLLGMSSRRANGRGVLVGFAAGISTSLLFLYASWRGWLVYASRMNANLHIAVVGFLVTTVIGYGVSLLPGSATADVEDGLTFTWKHANTANERRLWFLAGTLALFCLGLNYLWW